MQRKIPKHRCIIKICQENPRAQRYVTKPFDVEYLGLRRDSICLCVVLSWDAQQPEVIR